MKTKKTVSNRVCSLEKSGVRVDAGEAKDGEGKRPEAEAEAQRGSHQHKHKHQHQWRGDAPRQLCDKQQSQLNLCKTAGVVMALLIRRHWLLPLDGRFVTLPLPWGKRRGLELNPRLADG